MRIVITTGNATIAGGAEHHLQVVIAGLQDRGHCVALLTTTLAAPNLPSVAPPDVPTWSAVDRPIAAVVADIARWKADVVYAHGSALDADLVRHFPVVYFAHNYLGTCISGTKCHTFPGFTPCKRRLGPACMALYLPRRCGGLNPVTALRRYRQGRQWQRALQACSAVLVDSKHMAAEMIRNGIRADRVHVNPPFPTGVTPDRDLPAPRPFSGRILMAGRLTRLKGWSHLIDALPFAAAQLGRRLSLVVTGEGPDRKSFEAAAQRVGLAAEFLGWVDSDRRNAAMRTADLVAVPSIWPEPFGLTGLEAGCVGTPAVGYAVGGIPDWLLPGVSGESAPGERPDPRALAGAIARALSDATYWQHLRVGAWETARRFSPDAHLDRLIPILEAAAR